MGLLETVWNEITDYIGFFFSLLIATLRLFILTFLVFISGLQHIFFSRLEISSVELRALPLRCDRKKAEEKMSYIEKLCTENPTLAEIGDDDGFDEFPIDSDDLGE